jgi:pentatricopeptide repeat protein
MMYLSGRFDHLSVSIILEACGDAGAWQVARNICAKLFNDRFSFNLHNWNSWLECLCRFGRLNDALKVACLEMGKSKNNVVTPDEESARILIKYSKQANQHKEVLARVQRHLPELWRNLPEDLKQL